MEKTNKIGNKLQAKYIVNVHNVDKFYCGLFFSKKERCNLTFDTSLV